ncbi:hypothetical protein L209DRAFT_385864 [Thermothelomyces heterothallicus CBS 203.75]
MPQGQQWQQHFSPQGAPGYSVPPVPPTPASPGYDPAQKAWVQPVNTSSDVKTLRRAMKGMGCDEKALIQVLTSPQYANPWTMQQQRRPDQRRGRGVSAQVPPRPRRRDREGVPRRHGGRAAAHARRRRRRRAPARGADQEEGQALYQPRREPLLELPPPGLRQGCVPKEVRHHLGQGRQGPAEGGFRGSRAGPAEGSLGEKEIMTTMDTVCVSAWERQ